MFSLTFIDSELPLTLLREEDEVKTKLSLKTHQITRNTAFLKLQDLFQEFANAPFLYSILPSLEKWTLNK